MDNAFDGLNKLVTTCYTASVLAGWYKDPVTQKAKERNIGEMLALIHSEISEALEGYRKNLNDDHLPHRKMIEVELADAIIRICDLAGYLSLDLGGAVAEKLEYNSKREDHKLSSRAKNSGKRF